MKIKKQALLVVLLGCTLTLAQASAGVKYIFLMIGDGYGANQRYVTEALTGEKLAMSQLPRSILTGTDNAFGATTDSAASGTAIACGMKTYNGSIGLDLERKPVESLASKLQKRGFKVAMISSSPLTDATPAAHYAHQEKRSMRKEIGLDLARSGIAFAGGSGVHDPTTYDDLRAAGWEVYEGSNALAKARAGVQTFVNDDPFTQWHPGETSTSPTLAQYLTKTIELLDGPQGFFIMLENGHIDYSGHANDAGKMWREVVAFDEAVKVALAFQQQRPDETIVVVTADHETGGLEIDELNPEKLQLLRRQQAAKNDIYWLELLFKAQAAGEKEEAQIKALLDGLEQGLGITFTTEERTSLTRPAAKALKTKEPREKMIAAKRPKGDLVKLLSDAFAMRDERCGLRYTTTGHSSNRVITDVQGPGTEIFEDPLENSDLPHLLQAIVAPSIDDSIYQRERALLVANERKLAPYRAMPRAKDVDFSVGLQPVAIHESLIGQKSHTVELPEWRKFVERATYSDGQSYYLEIRNNHREIPLLLSLNIRDKSAEKRYYIFEPVSGTYRVKDDNSAAWSRAEIATSFRALCPPAGGLLQLVCTSQPPAETPEKLQRASDDQAAYDAAAKPLLYLNAKPAATPPQIDGQLDDAVWQSATTATFVDVLGNPLATKAASARFATDVDHTTLFIALAAHDTQIVAKSNERDTLQYNDDCFEVFLGDAASDLYYQIVVNPNGSIYDARRLDNQWNGNFEVKSVVDVEQGVWNAELAIPLAQLGFKGALIGNICHTDQPGNHRSNIAPTSGDFHKMVNFVPLILSR